MVHKGPRENMHSLPVNSHMSTYVCVHMKTREEAGEGSGTTLCHRHMGGVEGAFVLCGSRAELGEKSP